jgi:hypothetical protein
MQQARKWLQVHEADGIFNTTEGNITRESRKILYLVVIYINNVILLRRALRRHGLESDLAIDVATKYKNQAF